MAARKKQSRKKQTRKVATEQDMMQSNVVEAEDEDEPDEQFPVVTEDNVRRFSRKAFQEAPEHEKEEMRADLEDGLAIMTEDRKLDDGSPTTLSPDKFLDMQARYLTSKLTLTRTQANKVLSAVSASSSILEQYTDEDPNIMEDSRQVVPTFLYLQYKLKCLAEDATILKELGDTMLAVTSFISDAKDTLRQAGVE